MESLLCARKEILEIYNRNVDTVYRVCFSFMKNHPDTEDMVQEVFVKVISSAKRFDSPEHEKAWLIVTASNVCRDELRRRARQLEHIDDFSVESLSEQREAPEDMNLVIEAITDLPEEYKTVIYMYYYEGYDAKEIAGMLKCPHSTIRTRLARARKLLKKVLGGEFDEE